MERFGTVRRMMAAVLLVGLMTLCQTSFAAERSTATDGWFVVNCEEWISLREYPSTDAPVLARVPLGAFIPRVGRDGPRTGDFAHGRYKGVEGYALYEYLTSKATLYRVVNCNEWISLRAEPSVESATLCTIPLGSRVRYIADAENGFMHVFYNGYIGYALAEYLE